MPTNLYGPNDNFDLNTSHVLPALIRKFHEAKVNGDAFSDHLGNRKTQEGIPCMPMISRRPVFIPDGKL